VFNDEEKGAYETAVTLPVNFLDCERGTLSSLRRRSGNHQL